MQGGKYFLATYGCQMNVYDSEVISATMEGLSCYPVETASDADVIIFNTCCVRENADNKVYGRLGEFKPLKQQNKDLTIVVAGCLAQKDGEQLRERFPQVDLVLGTHNLRDLRAQLLDIAETRKPRVHVEQGVADLDLEARRSSTFQAWVPISVGCDEYCTFCIVPFVRGRMRSRPVASVRHEVKKLADQGFLEVTLLGQNVNAYGDDLDPRVDFADLLLALADIEKVKRLRFTSPHPRNFSTRVLDAMAQIPMVCEHVHLPLQAGDDAVLRRMNRPYTRDRFIELAEEIRARIPGVAISTDIIVGFAGETEAQFENTLDLVRRVQFDHAYMFAYSERAGTPAMKIKDHLPEEVRMDRLYRLIREQNDITLRRNQALEGQVQEVLVEGPSKKDPTHMTGRTRQGRVVNFPGGEDLVGRLIDVRLTRGYTWGLMGERAEIAAALR
ncbi:MAG: tRNA (N6-isopentenyl adenosine(37)-C2)-methylthiotransferase MiaB [Proteobacteria bacterium]|nr:tRNA (N6-isopentenyl adenosine(37)-C2)-methylthiotransferase MiaB [Pseudomonadota bacterium]